MLCAALNYIVLFSSSIICILIAHFLAACLRFISFYCWSQAACSVVVVVLIIVVVFVVVKCSRSSLAFQLSTRLVAQRRLFEYCISSPLMPSMNPGSRMQDIITGSLLDSVLILPTKSKTWLCVPYLFLY